MIKSIVIDEHVHSGNEKLKIFLSLFYCGTKNCAWNKSDCYEEKILCFMKKGQNIEKFDGNLMVLMMGL